MSSNLTVNQAIENVLYATFNNELDKYYDTNNNLVASKLPALLYAVNDGVNRLYARFRLKTDDLWLAAYESRFEYPITTEHFLDSWSAPSYNKYLWKEEHRPWNDDLIQILEVYDHHGDRLPINNVNSPFSVYTPEFNVLQIPLHPSNEYIEDSNPLNEPYDERTHDMVYSVKYQCSHKKLTSVEDNIYLPEHLHDCLSTYMAYKLYSNIGTEAAAQNAIKHFQEYQARLQEITQESLIQPEVSEEDHRFQDRGFI